MICNKCGGEIQSGHAFCVNCGTPVNDQAAEAKAPENAVYSVPSQESFAAPQRPTVNTNPVPPPPPQQMPYQNMYYSAPVNPMQEDMAPVTSIGTYILWFLLSCIPVVNIIVLIVFAIDGSNKNRANYYRAQIIWAVIVTVVALVLCALFGRVFVTLGEDVLWELNGLF